MQFNPEELGEHATDLRYAPNKLHGDEIEAASGTTYRADPSGEWLSHDEIEDLIQHSQDLEILLVHHSATYPPGSTGSRATR